MRIRHSCTLAVALVACAGAEADNPHVEIGAGGFRLHLPPAMQQALDAQAPGLRMVPTASFRSDVAQAAAEEGGVQPLYAVLGDFDGDGTQDAVVEGSIPGDKSLVVIAVLNKTNPEAIEVTRFDTYDADAVGVYLSKPPKGKSGAFEVVNYPDASTLYVFRNGKFAAR